MIKIKYSKDNLYLRTLEREKNDKRIKESNKQMKKLSDDNKLRIQ